MNSGLLEALLGLQVRFEIQVSDTGQISKGCSSSQITIDIKGLIAIKAVTIALQYCPQKDVVKELNGVSQLLDSTEISRCVMNQDLLNP